LRVLECGAIYDDALGQAVAYDDLHILRLYYLNSRQNAKLEKPAADNQYRKNSAFSELTFTERQLYFKLYNYRLNTKCHGVFSVVDLEHIFFQRSICAVFLLLAELFSAIDSSLSHFELISPIGGLYGSTL